MKPEKVIKEQAKLFLSKGFLGQAIAAFILLVSLILLWVYSSELIDCLFYEFIYQEDTLTIESLDLFSAIYLTVCRALHILLIFVTAPIVNGYLYYFYKGVKNEKPQLSDIFHFYKSLRLFSFALVTNAKLFLLNIGWLALFFLPTIIIFVATVVFGENVEAAATGIPVNIFISAFLLCIVNAKYFLSVFLHCEDEALTASQCLKKSAAIMRKSGGKIQRLTFSFTPQFFLSLLAVPAMYVFPMLITSQCISAKWIINIYDKDEERVC